MYLVAQLPPLKVGFLPKFRNAVVNMLFERDPDCIYSFLWISSFSVARLAVGVFSIEDPLPAPLMTTPSICMLHQHIATSPTFPATDRCLTLLLAIYRRRLRITDNTHSRTHIFARGVSGERHSPFSRDQTCNYAQTTSISPSVCLQ